MDKTTLEKICQQVYKNYPFVKGVIPSFSNQNEGRYLFIFKSINKTPDGKSIRQSIRVVATSDGKIIKTSLSR